MLFLINLVIVQMQNRILRKKKTFDRLLNYSSFLMIVNSVLFFLNEKTRNKKKSI